jgi:aconitate hydratase
MDIVLYIEPIGVSKDGSSVFLREIWPSQHEIDAAIQQSVRPEMFHREYASVFEGDAAWKALPIPESDLYAWDDQSTYIKHPPYFTDMPVEPRPVQDIQGARVLALLGDSITTDHISPAGAIKTDSPAGRYLIERGINVKDFNQYGTRRGNHEVMVRGTFANVRLRNLLNPDVEGGFTTHMPSGRRMAIFDASTLYQKEGVPLIIIAGKEYGSGSSRDWAAKGPLLLGVRAVIAESYERIHRSNLIGMGILPLQFVAGENPASLGLTGQEVFEFVGLDTLLNQTASGPRVLAVRATRADRTNVDFTAVVRIDTPQEIAYYRHGGILQYVLRQLIRKD